jgi:hypothetical protein
MTHLFTRAFRGMAFASSSFISVSRNRYGPRREPSSFADRKPSKCFDDLLGVNPVTSESDNRDAGSSLRTTELNYLTTRSSSDWNWPLD